MVWGGRPPSSRGPGPTPIGSTCLTLKFMKQHDYILPFNTKQLTIAFLDISLSLLWFQEKKTKIFTKLWPSSLQKSWIHIWLQYLIMRVKIEAYKFTVYHYQSHVHHYFLSILKIIVQSISSQRFTLKLFVNIHISERH